MQLAAEQFQQLATLVFGDREGGSRDNATPLTSAEAEAVIAIAELTISADDREDVDEIATYEMVAREVRRLAPTGEPATPAPDDAELADLAAGLSLQASELAYVISHVLTIVDLSLEPAEEEFLDELRVALKISPERTDELVEALNVALTPPE